MMIRIFMIETLMFQRVFIICHKGRSFVSYECLLERAINGRLKLAVVVEFWGRGSGELRCHYYRAYRRGRRSGRDVASAVVRGRASRSMSAATDGDLAAGHSSIERLVVG
jgi:hypothetical protein